MQVVFVFRPLLLQLLQADLDTLANVLASKYLQVLYCLSNILSRFFVLSAMVVKFSCTLEALTTLDNASGLKNFICRLCEDVRAWR